MHQLSELIAREQEKFAANDFFYRLTDRTRPLEQRLSFLPRMSHFIMSFADINQFVLPFSAPKDQWERAVNQHAHEDANHWPWFIHDLQQLAIDHSAPLSDTLRFLWSEQLAASRQLTYQLIAMIANQPAKIRLVVIEVMEATGSVMFTALSSAIADSGLTLKFCGDLHLGHESGHAANAAVSTIDDLPFSADEYREVQAIIHQGFTAFTHFVHRL